MPGARAAHRDMLAGPMSLGVGAGAVPLIEGVGIQLIVMLAGPPLEGFGILVFMLTDAAELLHVIWVAATPRLTLMAMMKIAEKFILVCAKPEQLVFGFLEVQLQ